VLARHRERLVASRGLGYDLATTPTSTKSVAGVTCRQTAATAGMSTKYAMIAKKMSWRPRRLPAGG
jgi:hypothetical protein